MSDPIESLIAGEHDRQERAWTADRAMDRIEAAGQRSSASFEGHSKPESEFIWELRAMGLSLVCLEYSAQEGEVMQEPCVILWSAIRHDDEDPLLKAEREAQKGLSE